MVWSCVKLLVCLYILSIYYVIKYCVKYVRYIILFSFYGIFKRWELIFIDEEIWGDFFWEVGMLIKLYDFL